MNSNSHVSKTMYIYDVIANDFGAEMHTIDHLVAMLILAGVWYRGSPVTTHKSRYGRFPPVPNDCGTMHPVLDTVSPLRTKEEGPPT
jgi:hypothetical protein